MLHAVILAGGSGTRLWPASRMLRPKQFLKVQGQRTMLQATADRLGDLVTPDRVWIATTKTLAVAVREQLPELPPRAVLAEPCPRNTAPCIGLAAVHILRDDPEGTMAVFPADQIIAPQEVFQDTLRAAAALVEEDPRRLVTFGIKPNYPSTGFGYIERGEALLVKPRPAAASSSAPTAYRVARFHEKPQQAVAQQYFAAGTYYWNSGMFVWKARTILDALGRHQPAIAAGLERIAVACDRPGSGEVLEAEFAAMPRISIDYAVMEHAEAAIVLEAPFAWDDVGGWPAWARYREADQHDNRIAAARHVEINAGGNVVLSSEPGRVVVLAGVKDLVVIVTPDAVLVADKRDEASVAAVTKELQARGWTEYL
jgi:mannose-1-phosphate guanylyltransferase